jgi:hypothetical protein
VLTKLDRRRPTVRVEVLVAEVTPVAANHGEPAKGLEAKDFTGPAAEVEAKVEALQGKGRLSSLRRLQLTMVEGTRASAVLGETKPYVTGVSLTRTGITTRQIAYRNLGTRVQIVSRAAADKKIDIELELEDARMVPDDSVTLGKDETGAAVRPMDIVTAHFTGKLTVGPGRAVSPEGVQTTSKSGKQQTLVVVTAQLAGDDEGLAEGGVSALPARRPRDRQRP